MCAVCVCVGGSQPQEEYWHQLLALKENHGIWSLVGVREGEQGETGMRVY